METIIFYIISAILIVFSVLTVTTNKILRAAVYLLFTLVATAAFYFMMEYEFLAAVQLTVYAGGIVVLIIFSILLTHQINMDLEKSDKLKKISSALIVLLGAIIVIFTISKYSFTTNSENESTIVVYERDKIIEISDLNFTFDEYIIKPNSLIIHLEDSIVVSSEKYELREIDANIKFTDSSFIGETILMNYRVYDTSVKSIGRQLLSYGEDGYVLPFEVISILLLAAMIAAIIIAKKSKE